MAAFMTRSNSSSSPRPALVKSFRRRQPIGGKPSQLRSQDRTRLTSHSTLNCMRDPFIRRTRDGTGPGPRRTDPREAGPTAKSREGRSRAGGQARRPPAATHGRRERGGRHRQSRKEEGKDRTRGTTELARTNKRLTPRVTKSNSRMVTKAKPAPPEATAKPAPEAKPAPSATPLTEHPTPGHAPERPAGGGALLDTPPSRHRQETGAHRAGHPQGRSEAEHGRRPLPGPSTTVSWRVSLGRLRKDWWPQATPGPRSGLAKGMEARRGGTRNGARPREARRQPGRPKAGSLRLLNRSTRTAGQISGVVTSNGSCRLQMPGKFGCRERSCQSDAMKCNMLTEPSTRLC